MRDADRLRRALRLVDRAERLGPEAGWHPSPSELTSYRDRRLPPRLAAKVRRHLGTCLDCPNLLLDLECFLDATGSRDGEEDLSWDELRPSLFDAAPAEPVSRSWALPPVLLSVRTAYAVAATSLLAAVALAIWSSSPRPQANVAFASVSMPGDIYRSSQGPAPQTVEVPADADAVALTVGTRFEDRDGLRLDILDGDGRLLRSIGQLRARRGEVGVSLPRSHLPAGILHLRLHEDGSRDGEERVTIQILHL